MASSFRQVLAALIDKRGESQRDFAAAVKFKQPSLAQIIKGRRRAPLRHVEAWADHLQLRGAKRERFILLAHLDHATPHLREYVLREHLEITASFEKD